MTGYIDGPSTFGTTPVAAQGVDAFAALYRDELPVAPAQIDVLRIGESHSDRGAGVAIGGLPQTLTLPGSFRGSIPFAGTTVASVGGSDAYLARVPLYPACSCVSVVAREPAPDAPAVRVTVAPNPSRTPDRHARPRGPG